MLIVGGGCRGLELAAELVREGHAARCVTRTEDGRQRIDDAGGECWIGTPDVIGTLRYALENVTLLLWLLGTASGEPELIEPLHGSRLRMMLEKTTDTTVRGVVYEAAGPVGAELTASGLAEMELAKEKNAIPYGLITADPLGDRDVWLAQAHGAIEALLAGPRRTTPDG